MRSLKETMERILDRKTGDRIIKYIDDLEKKDSIGNLLIDKKKEKIIAQILLNDSNNSFQNVINIIALVCNIIAVLIASVSLSLTISSYANLDSKSKVILHIGTILFVVLTIFAEVYFLRKSTKISDDNIKLRNYLIMLAVQDEEDKEASLNTDKSSKEDSKTL